MHLAGKIKLGSIKLQTPDMEAPIKAEGLEIEYDTQFTIAEAKETLVLVQQVPEVIEVLVNKMIDAMENIQARKQAIESEV